MSVRLHCSPRLPIWTRAAALVVSGGLCLGCRTGGSSAIVPTSGDIAYESASVDPASYAECPDPAECKRACDFPKEAIPDVPGTYVGQWNAAMIAGAAAQEFWISEHEWYDNGTQLGPEGRQHVRRLAEALADPQIQVIVEAADVAINYDEEYAAALVANAELNEQRRLKVVGELSAVGVADADQRVVVQPIERVGVHGVEAPRIYNLGHWGGMGAQVRGGGGGLGGVGGGAGG
ncbi:MAG: hypothetical protein SFV23_13890, partial [Planctomycetaceae bacterium]|nr:hypothetical protein [Planctomycetaceae bacterium]